MKLLITLLLLFAQYAQGQMPVSGFWRSSMNCKTTPWGPMANGASNTAYSSAAPVGVTCASVSETRSCSNGSLSGSYTTTTCSSGCAAGTTSNCDYSANASGGSSGSCASGYSGSCSYSCTNGIRNQVSNTCAASCGGLSYGGYCWYPVYDQGCDTFCSSHGGYNAATLTFAGSGAGSAANCQALVAATGWPSTVHNSGTCGGGYGCFYGWDFSTNKYYDTWCSSPATTATGSVSSANYQGRMCACNN